MSIKIAVYILEDNIFNEYRLISSPNMLSNITRGIWELQYSPISELEVMGQFFQSIAEVFLHEINSAEENIKRGYPVGVTKVGFFGASFRFFKLQLVY